MLLIQKKTSRHSLLRLSLALLSSAWLLSAHAQQENELGASLPALLAYAQEHNPEIAAMRYSSDAALQRVQPASAFPDPVLRTELMDINNQTANQATRFNLMQSLPWFGKRELRREVAEARFAQSDVAVSATWTDLKNQIKSAYAMHYYTIASDKLTRETLALLDNLEQVAQTRYANGIGTQQQLIAVQIEKTDLLSELIAWENQRHHSQAKLNALLSRPASAPLAEPVQLRAMPPAAVLQESVLLERMADQNPQLRIAQAAILTQEKARDLSYRDRYPDVIVGVAPTLSAGAIDRWDLMLELNIPLQQSTRRSQEHEAESMLAATTASRFSILNQVHATLSEQLASLNAAQRTESLIATQLLPQAELVFQSALAGYETGTVEFSMLIESQKQILKTKQQQIKAQKDMQLSLAEIEKLLGDEL